MKAGSLIAWLVCVISVAAPRLALACSVCTAGREDESESAFRMSTLFLSVLPLSMFAGFGLWIWLRVRRRERIALEAAPPPPV